MKREQRKKKNYKEDKKEEERITKGSRFMTSYTELGGQQVNLQWWRNHAAFDNLASKQATNLRLQNLGEHSDWKCCGQKVKF